jgi:hypothetical protein
MLGKSEAIRWKCPLALLSFLDCHSCWPPSPRTLRGPTLSSKDTASTQGPGSIAYPYLPWFFPNISICSSLFWCQCDNQTSNAPISSLTLTAARFVLLSLLLLLNCSEQLSTLGLNHLSTKTAFTQDPWDLLEAKIHGDFLSVSSDASRQWVTSDTVYKVLSPSGVCYPGFLCFLWMYPCQLFFLW